MPKSKPTKNDTQAPYRLFIRYSNITYFLIVSILLLIGIALLFFMVQESDTTADPSSQLINSTFDNEKETIQRIQSLSDANDRFLDNYSNKRINPFY